jgi:peptidoglycan/xylan/chitin deacetylase (PgdA/CDA1 family)
LVTPESDRAVAAPGILTYHKIGSQFELGVTSVTRKRFGAHLDALVDLGLGSATASATAVVVAVGPAVARSVAITFDDGYESVYTDAFPEICGRGLVATVFPVVGAVGGGANWAWDVRLSLRPFSHLSWQQVDELARHGFEVGSHTMSHRDLTRLADRDLKKELAVSKKRLEDRTGRGVTAIAYPFGRTNRRVVAAALEAGYRCGFLSAPVGLGLAPEGKAAPMALGRMSVYSFDGRASLLRKLGARRGRGLEVLKNMVISGLSRGTTLVTRGGRPAGDE